MNKKIIKSKNKSPTKPLVKTSAKTLPTQPTPTLNQKQYTKLLTDLKSLIINGKQTAEQNSTNQITLTYWQVGKRIVDESIPNNNNYQTSILNDLTNELDLERTTLSRCVSFFKAYKTPPKNQFLSWSHYRQLITIKDQKLRQDLENQAQKEQWSREQLTAAIKRLTNQTNPNQKTILIRPTNPTYLYKAKVLDVIDGDTLLLNIDLGFQVNKEQRIRLACLDCPEIKTEKGKKSFHWLRDKMMQLDSIMIKTHKVDIYGRYLGHVFYDSTNTMSGDDIFKDGVYLNEEILREGFGVVM